jgi:thymidylate kinase
MLPPSALLVAVEGPDGAGKTQFCQGLARVLEARGHAVTLTREPYTTGGASAGHKIKTGRASLADVVLDRDTHLELVILPALERGRIVITDRYWASTVVHQGASWAECSSRWPSPLWIHVITDQATRCRRILARGEELTPPEVASRYLRLPWTPVVIFGHQPEAVSRARAITAIEASLRQ